MSFRFIETIATADIAFEAWGNSREELFSSAAEALLATMVHEPETVLGGETVRIRLEHAELDLLLFAFLSELIFYKDARRLLLHAPRVELEYRSGATTLEAVAEGEEIAAGRHRLLVDVKAVTLHRLQVVQEDAAWKATVVLDI